MDKYAVLTVLLKLLVIVIILGHNVQRVSAAAMMGGHLDNINYTISRTLDNQYDMYSEYEDSREIVSDNKNKSKAKETDSEEIPDPSPLVVPGYNLPENIFNSGKPFYVEKDPLTGKIDFSHKTPEVKSDDQLYDYVDEAPSDNIYDKANINRKDGSISSHKHSDVNQLTPNFHDFLNLPVKYNPEKYVYPLISSSYASTKIQGSVNKFHNHKDYNSYKTTTRKATVSPTYYTTHSYFNPRTTQRTVSTTTVTTTTTNSPITKRYPEVYLTTPLTNVLNTGMSHPSFGEEYDYYDSQTEIPSTTTTRKSNIQQVYTTTKKTNIGDIYLTTNKPTSTSTTTKRTLSLFEQLFGDYDETVTTTEKAQAPTLFANLPNNKMNKIDTTASSTARTTTTTEKKFLPDRTTYPNVNVDSDKNLVTGTSMGFDSNYDYNDEYNEKIEDNLAVENKYSVQKEDSLSVEPLKPESNQFLSVKPQPEIKVTDQKPYKEPVSFITTEDSYLVQKVSTEDNRVKETTTTTTTTTTKRPTNTPSNPQPAPTPKVTSLPLGENHINPPSVSRDPIIVATQNLREKLNSEKVGQSDEELHISLNKNEPSISQVQQTVQVPQRPQPAPTQGDLNIGNKHAPSSSNIHIPAGQDTVSFVMGHHQSVAGGTAAGGQYLGSSLSESPYDSNPFRPLFGQQATYSNSQGANSHPQQQATYGNTQGSNIHSQNRPTESDNYPQRPVQDSVSYPQNRPVQDTNNYLQNRPVAPSRKPIVSPVNRPVPPPNFTFGSRPVAPMHPPHHIDPSGSAVTIQPLKQSEASLAIGVPVSGNKLIPGKVVDDKPYKHEGKIEFPKEGSSKIAFPQEKIGQPPQKNYPSQIPNQQSITPQNNREVLKLNSKPMYHQLPSDLTPPKENEVQPQRYDRPVRPPWDPRPGHFYAGKPEYARPPRPRPEVAYKRIDTLPNILPQFRPNAKQHYSPYHFERVNRPQPLFERPNNRPIGFFEKMLPPPPPQPFRANSNPNLRNNFPQIDERTSFKTNLQSLDENESPMAEDRIMNVDQENEEQNNAEESKIQELSIYQTPPNIKIPNRRVGQDLSEVETLQMIQAKNEKDNEVKPQDESEVEAESEQPIQIGAEHSVNEVTEKTIYKVYPVNTAPLKLDAIDSEKKEGVVVGTRAEMPLPPSKIDDDFSYAMKDRNDAPILKPHPKPQIPIKSDFPYALERPVQPTNNMDNLQQSGNFILSSKWDEDTAPKVVNGNKINYNQISATLKTYTEKPIAVAYTPTESQYDSYSISEIGRPGVVESEIYRDRYLPDYKQISHRIDTDIEVPPPERLGFQTPFQPSLQLDSANQGWTAVNKNKTMAVPIIETETTTMPLATTREFDIENFKPQLEGGFKPMYTIPEDRLSEPVTEVLEPRLEQ